jgi:hypothetical protein
MLCWLNTERLDHVMNRVEALLARAEMSLGEVKQRAVRLVKQIANSGVKALCAGVPVTNAGCTASGGMSRFTHRIISGTAG